MTEHSTDKLVQAYEQMLKHTHAAIQQTQRESLPRFLELLERSRDNMVALGELTREEADKVSDYIKRDIEDAASYIVETGQEMRDWWRFDLQLMEKRMLDMFTQVADQTSLQMAQLTQWIENTRQMTAYQAGEITGPGTLICNRCGAATHFVKAGRIPSCADCGNIYFRRHTEDANKPE